MKLAVSVAIILISCGTCASVAGSLIVAGWSRTDALLGAIVYALAVIGARHKP